VSQWVGELVGECMTGRAGEGGAGLVEGGISERVEISFVFQPEPLTIIVYYSMLHNTTHN